MGRSLLLDQGTDANLVAGVASFPVSVDATKTVKKIPTRGHRDFSLTSIAKTAGGAPAAIVTLKGTNNPDPADTSGKTLITNTHAAADQQDGDCTGKSYAYVFVAVSGLNNLVVDRVIVHGSGYAGLE